MKSDIHPEYFAKTTATCVCGAAFTVGSTKKDIKVESCQKKTLKDCLKNH